MTNARSMILIVPGLLMIAEIAGAQNQQISPPPPADLFMGDEPRWLEGGSLHCTLTRDTLGKKVTMWWRDETGAASSDDIALSYYPTALAKLSQSPPRFCVAGRTSFGKALIEVFRYSPPTVAQDTNGNIVIGAVTLDDIQPVYEQSTPGRDMVDHMVPALFNPECLVIQFWDSKDLYTLNLSDLNLVQLASSVATPGTLLVPELQTTVDRDIFWMGDHVTSGHVYVLVSSTTSQAQTLVLLDQNRDTVLDTYQVIPANQWEASGYADTTQYTLLQ